MRCENNHGSGCEIGQSDVLLIPGMILSLCLLRQQANVRHDVLHFSVGEPAAPRMHRTEDDAVLDGLQ